MTNKIIISTTYHEFMLPAEVVSKAGAFSEYERTGDRLIEEMELYLLSHQEEQANFRIIEVNTRYALVIAYDGNEAVFASEEPIKLVHEFGEDNFTILDLEE